MLTIMRLLNPPKEACRGACSTLYWTSSLPSALAIATGRCALAVAVAVALVGSLVVGAKLFMFLLMLLLLLPVVLSLPKCRSCMWLLLLWVVF